jgi:uncharacterized protein involved in exopolysaccharide biosynthesis
MSEKIDADNNGATDEVSLVDLLAVLIRKRKVWIGITLLGVLIGCILFLVGRTAPPQNRTTYTASVKALVVDPIVSAPGPDDKVPQSGNIAAAIATSGAAADLVAKAQGEEAAAQYRRSATAKYDEKTAVLEILVTSASSETAKSLAAAGAAATQQIFREVALRHYAPDSPKPNETALASLPAPAALPEFKIIDSKVTSLYKPLYSVKALILICFASLFLGLLAAFVANAWDRVKKDPDAMAKLQAAKRGE